MYGYGNITIACPPNLGVITLNGLRIASGYSISTIPDHLSSYEILQILIRFAGFADSIAERIPPLGIIISKYRAGSTVHETTLQNLERDPRIPPVFETMIPESNGIDTVAEWAALNSRRQRYGYRGRPIRLLLQFNAGVVGGSAASSFETVRDTQRNQKRLSSPHNVTPGRSILSRFTEVTAMRSYPANGQRSPCINTRALRPASVYCPLERLYHLVEPN